MKYSLLASLATAFLSTGALADQISVLTCQGELEEKVGRKTVKNHFEVTVVSGSPLVGGLAEILQSSPQARYAPVGHYIQVKKEGPPGGVAFTVYESKGGYVKLSIPEVQSMDLPVGSYRGTLKLATHRKEISVLCKDE